MSPRRNLCSICGGRNVLSLDRTDDRRMSDEASRAEALGAAFARLVWNSVLLVTNS
jgi:hypothetical protein